MRSRFEHLVEVPEGIRWNEAVGDYEIDSAVVLVVAVRFQARWDMFQKTVAADAQLCRDQLYATATHSVSMFNDGCNTCARAIEGK